MPIGITPDGNYGDFNVSSNGNIVKVANGAGQVSDFVPFMPSSVVGKHTSPSLSQDYLIGDQPAGSGFGFDSSGMFMDVDSTLGLLDFDASDRVYSSAIYNSHYNISSNLTLPTFTLSTWVSYYNEGLTTVTLTAPASQPFHTAHLVTTRTSIALKPKHLVIVGWDSDAVKLYASIIDDFKCLVYKRILTADSIAWNTGIPVAVKATGTVHKTGLDYIDYSASDYFIVNDVAGSCYTVYLSQNTFASGIAAPNNQTRIKVELQSSTNNSFSSFTVLGSKITYGVDLRDSVATLQYNTLDLSFTFRVATTGLYYRIVSSNAAFPIGIVSSGNYGLIKIERITSY